MEDQSSDSSDSYESITSNSLSDVEYDVVDGRGVIGYQRQPVILQGERLQQSCLTSQQSCKGELGFLKRETKNYLFNSL